MRWWSDQLAAVLPDALSLLFGNITKPANTKKARGTFRSAARSTGCEAQSCSASSRWTRSVIGSAVVRRPTICSAGCSSGGNLRRTNIAKPRLAPGSSRMPGSLDLGQSLHGAGAAQVLPGCSLADHVAGECDYQAPRCASFPKARIPVSMTPVLSPTMPRSDTFIFCWLSPVDRT